MNKISRPKTIVYLHGYGSSGQSGTVDYLRKKLTDCIVLAPDIPVSPKEALPFIRQYCEENNADLIIGTSMGGMYAMQMTGYKRVCVNPALRMSEQTEILKFGTWQYFQPTLDGRTEFVITEEIIQEFRDMEAGMFDNITPDDKRLCWGFFADNDTTVNYRAEFEEHFAPNIVEFQGEHRMTTRVIKKVIIPFLRELLK